MLKEQVAEITDKSLADLTAILIQLKVTSLDDVKRANEPTQEAIYSLRNKTINQILNLFKAEVDKLTVMGDEELTETAEMIFNFGIDIVGIKNLLWQQNKHQLQDIQKQILGLMGV